MTLLSATRILNLFCLLPLLFLGQDQLHASQPFDLIVWHPFVGVQEKLLSEWVKTYAKERHLAIRLESGFDINTALRKKAGSRQFPDVVVGPSDLLNVSDSVPLRPILQGEFLGRKFIEVKGERLAVRLFENGSHFLLRKKNVEIPSSRSELLLKLKRGSQFVWANAEPLFLLSFLLAESRNAEGMGRALRSFGELMRASNTPFPCNHKCLWNAVLQKKSDYIVVGDWLFPELEKINAGQDYALEPLPPYLGKCSSMPYVAFFPKNDKSKKRQNLNSNLFVSWLSSNEIQERFQLNFLQRPSATPVRIAQWPTWMRRAISLTHRCSDVSELATPEFWALSSAAVRQMGSADIPIQTAVDSFLKQYASAISGSPRVGK